MRFNGAVSCSLRALFIALNDESAYVRALAIRLAGRLAPWNPAYVLPALRNHLQQLLTDMEQSPDSRQREGKPEVLAMHTVELVLPIFFSRAEGNPILKLSYCLIRYLLSLQRVGFQDGFKPAPSCVENWRGRLRHYAICIRFVNQHSKTTQ